ncbi:MAG: glycosyltransferase [Planctomycetota bacterium]
MQVLMLADRSFARREQPMLRRLQVGLMDEGVRVVHAVPEVIADLETDSLTTSLTYADRGPWYAARARTRRLIRQIEELDPPLTHNNHGGALDVVHAWGDGCWATAVDVADATGAGIALDLWSAASVSRMRSIEDRARAGSPDAIRGVWLAPNAALEQHARTIAHTWPIRLSRWGVHPGEKPARRYESSDTRDRPLALSIISSGRSSTHMAPLLDALAALINEGADLMIFLDAAAVEKHHSVWRHAERAGLLSRLSVIPDMESRRALLLETDVLLLPDAQGEVRSVILDAMAAGIVVVAGADPFVEVTATPNIALLIDQPAADAWKSQLTRVVNDHAFLAQVGRDAREQVHRNRPAHRHVEAILSGYRLLTEQQPIAFPVQ